MIPQLIFSVLLSIVIFVTAFNVSITGMGLMANLNALIIVLGGTLAATLIAYPFENLVWTFLLLKKTFLVENEIDWTIDKIVDFCRTYRYGGIRALEQEEQELPEGLLKTTIGLMTLNHSREEIEQIINREIQIIRARYDAAHRILYSMARLAPALGLTGTVVALIRVFSHITDPKSLVGYMAIALLNTFYGVALANLLFVPLSNKLREFIAHNEIRIELILEGILDVYDRENPSAVRYKLEAIAGTVTGTKTRRMRPRLAFMSQNDRITGLVSQGKS